MFGKDSLFFYIIGAIEPSKHHLGPQSDPKSLGSEKL
jgi:hypothetical protein